MKLSSKIKKTFCGLKKSRKKVDDCADFEPEPCKTVTETLETNLYEILLTHPQFSWLVTDTEVSAKLSIRERDMNWSPHKWWVDDLCMNDKKTVTITVTQRERCGE